MSTIWGYTTFRTIPTVLLKTKETIDGVLFLEIVLIRDKFNMADAPHSGNDHITPSNGEHVMER